MIRIPTDAHHFGLTDQEYYEYKRLKYNAERCGWILFNTNNNESTRKDYDRACEELADFEIKHEIIKKL